MKLSTKIIGLIILAIILFIALYPVEDKPDFMGNWTLDKVVINGKSKTVTNEGNAEMGVVSEILGVEDRYTGAINIYETKITVNEYNLLDNSEYKFKTKGTDSIIICCKRDNVIIKDSLSAFLENTINLEGTYKVEMYSKILGAGDKAYYDNQLKFISKNKSIFMYNTEPVRWNRGLPARGTP